MSKTLTTTMLAEQFVLSMQEIANRLDYRGNQLNTITREFGGGIENVGRMEFNWRSRRLAEISVTVTADAAVGATTISVSEPTAFHVNQQVYYADDTVDMFYVDEAEGGGTTAGKVTVRGKTGSGGITTALTAGDILLVGPQSHAEGADIPAAFSNVETYDKAYCFQSDETIKLSDIAMAEDVYGLDEIVQQRKDKAIERLKRINIALYKSVGGREVVSGSRRSSMTGLMEYLAGYTDDATSLPSGLTLATIAQLVRPTTVYDESSEDKAIITGQNANMSISAMPNNALRVAPGKGILWGVSVKKLETGIGTLNLVNDPLLSEENGMQGEMFVLSSKRIKQVQLQGMPVMFKMNVQGSDDIHNQVDVYTGTLGLRLANPENSRRITNI